MSNSITQNRPISVQDTPAAITSGSAKNIDKGACGVGHPEKTTVSPKLLTIPEFCSLYRQSRSVAYELLGSGGRVATLAGVKVGRRTFISIEEAERWRKSLPSFKALNAGGGL